MTNSAIPYFHWVNRQTTANDVFALLNHESSGTRFNALRLLKILKPKHLSSELVAMYSDQDRDRQENYLILEIIHEVGINIDIPDIFQRLTDKLLEDFRAGVPHIDTAIEEIIEKVYYLPNNQVIFFERLTTLKPVNQMTILLCCARDYMPQLADPILQNILNLLEQDSELMKVTWDYVEGITTYLFIQWLKRVDVRYENHTLFLKLADDYRPNIQVLLLEIYADGLFHGRSFQNMTLKKYFFDSHPELEKIYHDATCELLKNSRNFVQKMTKYRKYPVYISLRNLYIEAKEGNQAAYRELIYYAEINQFLDDYTAQRIQPLAVHFLGKLSLSQEFIELIYRILANLPANYQKPILYEASFILLKIATPQAWETLINVYMSRSYRIANYAIEWIGYLTDLLNGETPTIPKSIRPREREWFFEGLDNISENDFKRLKRLFRE